MRFIGIDFGWKRQASGLALFSWNGHSLHLEELAVVEKPADIVEWVSSRAGADAVVGIDAPTVIPNDTGLREVDTICHKRFGRHHGGIYPPNRERDYWLRTTGFAASLAAAGFHHGDAMPPRASGRWQIEVFPNAATLHLFSVDRIIAPKNISFTQRRAELVKFRETLLDQLPRLTPRLAVSGVAAIPAFSRDIKPVISQIEAVLDAYIAAYWWYWGTARNEVLGDSTRGYVVIPQPRPAQSNLADLRESYMLSGLLESEMDADPIAQFESWFEQARAAKLLEANAMTLATASSDGVPSARIVLLKGLSADGFVFYTNYESQKGRELDENPRAALVFYWGGLERQVRIQGNVSRVTREESESYFQSRPQGHRLGAWASRQSTVISGRPVLEEKLHALEAEYGDKEVPLPDYWGGYSVKPQAIEFWQGRPNRLHDRIRYRLAGESGWTMERLSP
jgi:pyridoxamine 5'-phosphate oxidase